MVGAFKSTWARFAVLGLVFPAVLIGCSRANTVQEAIGYEQKGPDELAVIKRPPLSVPPDYNLRPPRPGDRSGAAASVKARETLIGPSSSIERTPSDARAILTGTTPENGAGDAVSEGQNLLLSRTDRAERDLDKITENRVDNALLRRLLAWTPDDRKAPEGGDEADAETLETAAVVQVVSRSQTVIGGETAPDQAETE